MNNSIRLYKSLTPIQFAAVIRSGWREFSVESDEQKIFYPKLHREYAEMVARMFNLAHYTAAYVVEFKVNSVFMARYDIQTIAYEAHKEYKIPVEDLPQLNGHILGTIDVVSAFTLQDCHCQSLIGELRGYH